MTETCPYRKAGVPCDLPIGCGMCEAGPCPDIGYTYCLVFGDEIMDTFDDPWEAISALESNCDDACLVAIQGRPRSWRPST